MTLTLAEANTIVAAAIAKARQLNIIVNVAVCDGARSDNERQIG